jgi:two-component system, NtrC family, sensor kinase
MPQVGNQDGTEVHRQKDLVPLYDTGAPALRAECDLLRSELSLRNCALNAAAAHFMIIDALSRPTRILFVNRALAECHGYTPEELIGTEPSLLVSIDECRGQYAELIEAMRAGNPVRVHLRSRRRNGSSFWAGVALGPVRDDTGRITHFVTVGSDITQKLEDERNRRDLQFRLIAGMEERERMAVELRIAQKLEAVGQLAAGIAHEINTPVQYIGDSVLFLQTAVADIERLLEAYRTAVAGLPESDALTAARAILMDAERSADLDFVRHEAPKAFERTLEGVKRVADIVRAMKEFAHPDTNEQSAADINHALETTLTVACAEYKYIARISRQFGDIPAVTCNISELNQVFLNLIVNAAHAIQESGKDAQTGLISIATRADDASVCITIGDNGCGIPEKIRERIFDPFFTTKAVGKGTGQGLSIARSIVVERHGGRIDVRSEENVGTTFEIHLPLAGRKGGAAS